MIKPGLVLRLAIGCSPMPGRQGNLKTELWYWFSLTWHAHLARDFTAGTAVPLTKVNHYLNFIKLATAITLLAGASREALGVAAHNDRIRSAWAVRERAIKSGTKVV